jgi:hypothetical protein
VERGAKHCSGARESQAMVVGNWELSGGRGELQVSSGGGRETGEPSCGCNEMENRGKGLSNIEDESAMSSDDDTFDDWVISVPSLDRKILTVSLSQSFISRQKMKTTDAVIEAASFVGLNERTVGKYCTEFFTNHGQFPETKGGQVHYIL